VVALARKMTDFCTIQGLPHFGLQAPSGQKAKNKHLMKVPITLFSALVALFLASNAGYGQCGTEISCDPAAVITCAQPTVSIGCEVVGQAPFAFAWADAEGNIVGTENLLTTSQPGSYTLVVTDATGCATSVEVLVAEDTQTPQLSLVVEVQSQPYCSADADGAISVQASGGLPPYAYLWSGGNPDEPLLTGLSAGIYEVTVADAAGCAAVASATLEPELRADAGPDPISQCDNSQATLGGFAHTEVYFSSDMTPIAFANSDGESVAFTGVPGRIGSNSSPPDWPNTNGLTLSIATQNARVGELVCLPVRAYDFDDIVAFGFTINYDTAHLRLDAIEQLNPNIPGFSLAANIGSVPEFPGMIYATWSIPTVPISGIDLPDEAILFTLCFEVLDNQVPASSSGPEISYQWTGPGGFTSTELFPQVTENGVYTLRVTDNAIPGCWSEDSVEVVFSDSLQVTIGDTLRRCRLDLFTLEAQVVGGTPPYSYLWSNGHWTPSITTYSTISRTYSVTVVDALGCEASGETYVRIFPIPNIQFLGAFCDDNGTPDDPADDIFFQDAVINGGTGLGWVGWRDSVSNVTDSGAYGVPYTFGPYPAISGGVLIGIADVTNPSYCGFGTIFFPPPGCQPAPCSLNPMALDFDVIPVSCAGVADGGIMVNVTSGLPPYSYLWSIGANTPQMTSVPAGMYYVTVTDSNGCTAIDSIELIGPAVVICSYDIVPPSCSNSNDGAISITNCGGVPPYTYTWSNGFMGTSLAGLAPGVYAVTVTDANGCTSLLLFVLLPALQADAGADLALDCTSAFVTLDGSGSNSGPEIAYLWTGPQGFSSILLSPQVSIPGIYRLRVIDTSRPDCYAEDEVEVIDGLTLQLEYALLSCDSAHLSFSAWLPIAEGEWSYPDGDIVLANEIATNQSGYHHFSATDPGTGCTIADSIYINLDPAACVTVAGRLVRDTMPDCIATAEEPGLHNWLIALEGSGQIWYAVSQADGYYEKRLPTGDYEAFPILPNDQWLNCEERYPVSLLSAGNAAALDIPVLEIEPCPVLSINLSLPLLRACWPRTLFLSYCNEGTTAVEDAYVVLTLDEFFTFISASLPLITQEGDQYTFFIGDLAVNECGAFTVQVEVSCQAVWGQTLCGEAKIFPNAPCFPPSPLWSGASLRVSGQCVGDEARFVVENIGASDMDAPSRAIIIEDGVMLMAVPDTVRLGSGESIEYTLPANGATYRLEVEQVSFHPGLSMPSAVLEGCGPGGQGSFSTGFVNQFPLDDEDAFVDIECREIVAAYDPNDKHGFPRGYGEQHQIYPGLSLEYLVRFQNTGNDTAFLVVIRDTLSPFLDVASIRPGAASHPYTWDIDGQSILVFTFEDILLPDSTTNLEGSQGFVEFKIAQREDLPLGTRIENRAAIYFDLNAPILTNTTFHTLGVDFVETITAIPDPGRAGWGVEAHPNPAEGWALFRMEGWAAEGGWFELFGSQGQALRQQRFSGAQFRFERGELPSGIYFYHFRDGQGRLASGKLMLR
jgi:hypothetical protein